MSKKQESSKADVSKDENVFTTLISSTQSNADTTNSKLSKPTTDQSNYITKYDYDNSSIIANIINTPTPTSKDTQDSVPTTSSSENPSILEVLGKNSSTTNNDSDID